MKIQFLGACSEVGGSMILLESDSGFKMLVDCGFVQSGNPEDMFRLNNRPYEFNAEDISVVLATHGHYDHISGLGLLVKRGFTGKILCTQATSEFMAINLKDSAKIMKADAFRIKKSKPGSKIEPLYDDDDVDNVISMTRGYNFDQEIQITKDIFVTFRRAGHMLGASIIHITYKEGKKTKTVAFSGDTSAMRNKPFLPVADPLGNISELILEATYGNRVHEPDNSLEVLAQSIATTCIENKKPILIPSFALQRSSEILWLLREVYMKHPEFNKIPIYLDSPMSILAQGVMDGNREFWGERWIERDNELGNLFEWNVINYIENHRESESLNTNSPMIVISSSGMLNSGRVLMHLENILKLRDATIIMSGYQAESTLGRRLLETSCKSIAVNRRPVPIRANILQINLSSHGDKNQLVEYVKSCRKGALKTIYLNHGDEDACESLKNELELHLKNVSVIIPEYKDTFALK